MRETTLLNNLLDLPGTRVVSADGISAGRGPIEIEIALRRRKLMCPSCDYATMTAYDTRTTCSRWRHLDLAGRRCWLRMHRRRLRCPEHGVRTESVPFARAGAGFTRDMENMIAWLVTRADKTTVATFARIAWRTVGSICERVAEDLYADVDRLAGLVDIGVDEISWRKHHKYLTLVTDHDSSTVVWGAAGKNAAALDSFFTDLGPERTAQIQAVTMDLGQAYIKSVAEQAPNAAICFDAFHVVKLGTDALDKIRRQIWQSARRYPDKQLAKLYKGARWALLKNPDDLTDKQRTTLAGLEHDAGVLWDAYQLKEALRAIFAGDLSTDQADAMITAWCTKADNSGIPEFITVADTLDRRRDGILAALDRQLSNGRHEGLNNKIRTMTRRAYGFHSPEAALALIALACGPATPQLPYHNAA